MRPSRLSIATLGASLLVAASAFAAGTLEGSGRAASEERTVSGFTALAVTIPAQVELVQGEAEGATVTADDNVVRAVRTVVRAGALHVDFPPGLVVHPRTPIRLVVRARTIDSISLAGAARIEAARLASDRLSVDLSGTAQAVLPELAAQRLSLHTSGHCHAMAAGSVEALELRMSGSGEVNAARLEAARASVRISGSAQVALWVHEALDASVAGSGSVHYFGDPAIERRVVGSGRLERLGASPP